MRRTLFGILAQALALTFSNSAVTAQGAEDLPRFAETIIVLGELTHQIPVPAGKAFEVAFKVGDLDIEARPVAEAELELHADCKQVALETCRRALAKIKLITTELDDRVRVQIRGLRRRIVRRYDISAAVIVPSRSPLIVRMGIGELEIDAGPEDLDVAMSIGDLTIRAPRASVARVDVATRIGDASLHTDDHVAGRRRFLGARVAWHSGAGPTGDEQTGDEQTGDEQTGDEPSSAGDSRIQVKLKIGDASVHLN